MGVYESIKKYTCNTCGKEWFMPNYHGGSIEHDNYTNDHNMNVCVHRARKPVEGPLAGYEYFFKRSIMLDGNFCNIKDNSYKTALEVFECRILWLLKNGHYDLAEYLESRRDDIKKYYNEKTQKKIDEKLEEIEKIKKDFIE